MSSWYAVMHGFEDFLLIYFSILALIYALAAFLGLRAILVHSRELSQLALKDLVQRDFYKPVSILVPAYNEEQGIVESVRSFLALRHPQFEVVVGVDGATDGTMERLVEGFDLQEEPRVYRRSVETKPVRRILRSPRHPNLTVVDKENGGRADAVNSALNVASYPLVCVVDADSMLSAEALARASLLFVEDESVVAVGGSLRPLNGAVVRDGEVVELGAPRNWVERMQVLEYARSFFIARAAWSRIGCLLIISGAFGLFRRDAAIEAGGWEFGMVADDMEMVIKLHRRFREFKQPYRIVATPDPVCWTEVPTTFRALRAQRRMWERGMMEVLLRHKRMLFNPRYGRVGLVGIPYLWVFEVGAAFVETAGYLYILLTLALGVLNVTFALMFLLLAILFGTLLSELAMGIETILLARYERTRDRLMLLVASVLEYLGFRQSIVLARVGALFRMRSQRGRYWTEDEEPSGAEQAETPTAVTGAR